MSNRRVLDVCIHHANALVADALMMHCRYEPARRADHPEAEIPMRLVTQAHRVAMSRIPPHQKRDGCWEDANPDKWQRLGANA